MEFEDVFADVMTEETQGSAEGGAQETTPAGDEQQEPEQDTQGGADEPAGEQQNDDANAQFAAARRRAEAEFNHRLELAQQQHAREMDEFVRDTYAGQANPYTGQPIRSKADLDAYQQQYEAERLQQAGITPDMIQDEVLRNPIVQQLVQQNQQMQMAQGKMQFESGLAEISKLDPSIQTLDDLMQSPVFADFDRLFMASGDMVSAYKAASYDRMASASFDAGAQAQRNGTAGKSHLTPMHGGANETTSVPDDVAEIYRAMFPDMTEAQIAADYKKNR